MENRTKAYYKLTKYIIFFSFELIFCSISYFEVEPSISFNSYSFAAAAKFEVNSNFFVYHKYNFFKVNYPFERPLKYQKIRYKSTGVNEQSYLAVNNNDHSLSARFGRSYLSSGPGVISGLFLSPESPSVDNFSYQINLSKNIKLQTNIIRLDNREVSYIVSNINSKQSAYFNRWYYHHRIELKYNRILTVGFKEAVVSTGENRSIEWYYLLPLGPFHAEQLNQKARKDGLYVRDASGIGNNDNGMVGLDFHLQVGKNSIYGEACIDEFQIDKEDRKKMQDVFGLLFGFNSNNENFNWAIEYSYASPWLYLNRGRFSSPEVNGFSLGLKGPNFQSLSIKSRLNVKSYKIGMKAQFWMEGAQSLDSDWDAWQNKIDYFDFNDFEIKNRYKVFVLAGYEKASYEFGVSYNWLYQKSMQFYCSAYFKIN